jgi:hypothetical protein
VNSRRYALRRFRKGSRPAVGTTAKGCHSHVAAKRSARATKAIFVLDDDIIISGTQISWLSKTRKQYDLQALQPAFSPCG